MFIFLNEYGFVLCLEHTTGPVMPAIEALCIPGHSLGRSHDIRTRIFYSQWSCHKGNVPQDQDILFFKT